MSKKNNWQQGLSDEQLQKILNAQSAYKQKIKKLTEKDMNIQAIENLRKDGGTLMDSVYAGYKEPNPKKPTAKELQAQAIERIRKGEGTLSDSLTANIVPTDVQQAKQDVKPSEMPKSKTEEQIYNERKKELDFILASPSLPEEDRAFYENEMIKLEDSKFTRLTKGKKTAKKISNIDQKDDPSTIEKIFNWGANKWKKSVSDSQWVSARRKYWQGEGLKSLSLSDEEIKSIKGNDNGYTWALKKAKEDFEIKKENEGKVFVDANGIKAKMVNGKWVEVD